MGACGCCGAKAAQVAPCCGVVIRYLWPDEIQRRSLGRSDRDAAPPRQIGEILPRHPARARPARGLPFDRLGAQRRIVDLDPMRIAIAPDHGEILVLVAGMKAQPETETITERNLFLGRFRGADRRGAFILDHVARHQVATVRCGVEDHVVGPPLDPAIEHRLQGFVMLVVMAEGEIVAKQDEARFILFCDDLSFSHDDQHYKSLKAVLDGGIEGRPDNVVFYATSNRRHLMPRDMIENERASAISPSEATEEKVSLSDRFGLWLGFHPCGQDEYLAMIDAYCAAYGV